MAAIKVECVGPDCEKIRNAKDEKQLVSEGWREIRVSSHPPPHSDRTHVGWCPKCALKFSVAAR